MTEEDEEVIESAIKDIIRKHIDFGDDPETVNEDGIRWALIGTLRWKGVEAVKRVVEEYKPISIKNT